MAAHRAAAQIVLMLVLAGATCSGPGSPPVEEDRYTVHADPVAGSLRIEHTAHTARKPLYVKET